MKLKELAPEDIQGLVSNTAERLGIHEAIVEKDFWVTVCLNFLFEKSTYRNHLIFKGGTSLSKAYHIIERFSEDIDLILDWCLLGYEKEEPWENRSKTKQDLFNKQVLETSAAFISEKFLPELIEGLEGLIGKAIRIESDAYDPNTINIYYPSQFQNGSILPYIRLEVGALAAWTPSHAVQVRALTEDYYPELVDELQAVVMTVDVKRTFWEKATILHHEAYRPSDKLIPARYFRHYYDLYLLSKTTAKAEAFHDLSLLQQVVDFKEKFYPRGWARYDLAKHRQLRLVPDAYRFEELRKDYVKMQDMIYGEHYEFDDIMLTLTHLENAINELDESESEF